MIRTADGDESTDGARASEPTAILLAGIESRDQRLVRTALQREFPRARLEAVDSMDGFHAALAHENFDVALIDFSLRSVAEMPEVQDGATRAVPRILLTSASSDEAGYAARSRFFDGHVVKTLNNINTLPAAIRRILERWGVEQARREVERSLERARRRYQDLAAATDDLLLVVDDADRVIEINRAARGLLRIGDEAEAPALSSLFASPAQESALGALKQARTESTPCTIETELAVGNSEPVHVVGTVAPVKLEDGRTCLRLVLRDVSGQRRLADARRQLADSQAELRGEWAALEERIAARTRELAEGAEILRSEVAEVRGENEDLRTVRAELQALLQASPAVGHRCTFGSPYAFRYISGNAARVTGYDPSNFTGDPAFWMARIDERDRAEVEAAFDALMAGGRGMTIEYRYRHKDGGLRWMRDDLSLRSLGEEAEAEIIGGWLDVTDMHQVRDGERLAQQIALSTEEMLAYIDATYTYRLVNDRYLAMFSKSREEILGRTVGELLGKDDFEALAKPYLDRCLAGNAARVEVWRHLDGLGRRCLDIAYRPLRDDEDRIVGVVSTIRDITDHRRAEDASRSTETRFQELFDDIRDAYFHLDRDGKIVEVNRAGAEMLGYRRESLLDRSLWSLATADQAARLKEQLHTLLRSPVDAGVQTHGVLRLAARNGTPVVVEQRGRVLRDADGDRIRMVFRDVTEQHEREKRERDQASQEMLALAQERDGLREELDDTRANLSAELDSLRRSTAEELNTTRSMLEQELNETRERAERSVREAREQAAREIAQRSEQHKRELNEAVADAERVLTGTRDDYESRISAMREEWEGRLADSESRARQELAQTRERLEGELDTLRTRSAEELATTRERSEALLRETRTQLEMALAGARGVLWEWDAEADAFVFPLHPEELGYVPGQLPETIDGWLKLVHPDDRGRFTTLQQRLLEAPDRMQECESRLRLHSGEWRWYQVRCRCVTTRGDSNRLVLGMCIDIHARKTREQTLGDAEQRFRNVFRQAALPMGLIAGTGALVECNAAFSARLQSPEEDLTGRNLADLVAEADREIVARNVERFMAGGFECCRIEASMLVESEPSPAALLLTPTQGDAGPVSHAVLVLGEPEVMVDASLRTAAEAVSTGAVQGDSREADAGTATRSWQWRTGKDLKLTFVSPGWEAVSGIAASEVVGRALLDAFAQPSDANVLREARMAIEERQAFDALELRLPRDDGSFLQLRLRGQPSHRGADGAFIGYEGTGERVVASTASPDEAPPRHTDAPAVERPQAAAPDDRAHAGGSGTAGTSAPDEVPALDRTEFQRRLEAAIGTCRRSGGSHALCYLRIPALRGEAGEARLPALRGRLRPLLEEGPEGSAFARLGDGVFGLLLPGTSIAEAVQAAEKISGAVYDLHVAEGWDDVPAKPAVGVVGIDEGTRDGVWLLSQGDLACYRAGERGEGEIFVLADGTGAAVRAPRRTLSAADVETALREGRLRLYSQPIAALEGEPDSAVDLEILLRMEDESGEVYGPNHFLPVAEQGGLLAELDRWSLQTALSQLDRIRDGFPGAGITLNLSAPSVGDETLADFLAGAIREAGVPPEVICFEIAETVAVGNIERAIRLVRNLKKLGCRFTLDHFGRGLSSFHDLKSLPVDYLKIDGSFVLEMGDEGADHAMVRAVMQVGRMMGIETIAECADTPVIVARLRELGVHYAQGQAMGGSRPV